MKKMLLFGLLISSASFAQESGNIQFEEGNRSYKVPYLSNKTFDVPMSYSNEIIVEVNAMINLSADSYVAVFHVTQMGKTAEEANNLMTARLKKVTDAVKEKSPESTIFLDMLTFVPVYEYAVEKKLFSKDTYNEIPKGFQLKKNIHIQYKDANLLSDFIAICTQSEIYDLIKVDYVVDDLDAKKKELANKAVASLKEKIGRFEDLMHVDFETLHTQLVEGYQVHYPVERYSSYNAFSSASLDAKEGATVNKAQKTRSSYYNPVSSREFDIVINPAIVQPTVQLLYQVKIKVVNTPKSTSHSTTQTSTKYLLITPNGDLKNLPISN